ncbi:hypothetical protein MP638_003843 [Amoeboaphelidium occidentale]|nr:hypothetical protein MP638_003843 [Amoeboaphelidium occidentale]
MEECSFLWKAAQYLANTESTSGSMIFSAELLQLEKSIPKDQDDEAFDTTRLCFHCSTLLIPSVNCKYKLESHRDRTKRKSKNKQNVINLNLKQKDKVKRLKCVTITCFQCKSKNRHFASERPKETVSKPTVVPSSAASTPQTSSAVKRNKKTKLSLQKMVSNQDKPKVSLSLSDFMKK